MVISASGHICGPDRCSQLGKAPLGLSARAQAGRCRSPGTTSLRTTRDTPVAGYVTVESPGSRRRQAGRGTLHIRLSATSSGNRMSVTRGRLLADPPGRRRSCTLRARRCAPGRTRREAARGPGSSGVSHQRKCCHRLREEAAFHRCASVQDHTEGMRGLRWEGHVLIQKGER